MGVEGIPHRESLEEIGAAELLGYTCANCDLSAPYSANLVLKEGNLFFLTDARGNVPGGGRTELGLFHEDTRYLSQWELVVLDHKPSVLSSHANRVFCNQIDLTTSWTQETKDIFEHNYIHIRRRQVVGGKLIERLRISNYLNIPQQVRFEIRFGADFADMFEVRGLQRSLSGTYYRPVLDGASTRLHYLGRDGVMRTTRIVFDTPPTRFDGRCAFYEISIAGGGGFLLEIHVIPESEPLDGARHATYEELYRTNAEKYAVWRAECSSIRSEDQFLYSSLSQSVTDLRALFIEYDGQPIISAGIPWYSTPFGRDSIITSLQTLMVNPNIARDTLCFLAKYQGTKVDDFTSEEPGKIMHELRRGELARCREIPHLPYYGTIDATPLFLVLLHEYYLWTGDEALIRQLLPAAEQALHWIDAYGDVDGDGLIEYWKYSEHGILHQGWKDSVDGVMYPDGTQPQLPISLIEVQGYVFDAKMRMSRLFREFGMQERARQLRAQAQAVQSRIEERFWMKDKRYYALALDGRKRIVPSIASNPGHLLYSKAVANSNASRVEQRLMSDDMYSGWGVRTFSSKNPAFNPLSYHNGSVWPHDNSIIAAGLCNYGYKRSAERIFNTLYEACLNLPYYRLPELFCGMARKPNDWLVQYPVACTPQAWAAATFFLILQGLIGVRPDAPHRRLYIENPRLPAQTADLMIHDMRIGQSRVTLRITRHNDRTFVNVVEQTGEPIRVTIELG